MKLLLISVLSQTSKGGIAVWTEGFMEGCQARGISCDLVNTEMVGKRMSQGSAKRNLFDEFKRTKRIFRDLKHFLKHAGASYDLAHLNTSCGTFGLFRDYLVAKRIKKKGLPLVTHFHCDIPYWIHNSISKTYLKKLATLSDQRFVLCESSRQYLKEHFNLDSQKIPNFIDESLIRSEQKPISESIRSAFFVGRVSEPKGAAELFALARKFPQITFELAGDPSDTVAAWDVPDNLHLLGGLSHDEVLRQMDQADVFLFPTHSEGFSLALMEAMARGLPAIATNVGANQDMLADQCGRIVEIGQIDAMADALCELNAPNVRTELSQNSITKVKNTYTLDAFFEKILKLYLIKNEENEQ